MKKKKSEELEALKRARIDIKKDKTFYDTSINEDQLEDYIDNIKSTKEDVFYEPEDGIFERNWKKLMNLFS